MTKPREVTHGYSEYNRRGCRCDVCKAANTAHHARQRGQRYERTRLNGGVAPIENHGIKTAQNWGCSCEICRGAIREMNLSYRSKYKETIERSHARIIARHQSETLPEADRWGYEWTGRELQIVAREDLTAKQLALILGRSYFAVRQARKRLRASDPTFVAKLDATKAEDVE